MFWGVGQVEEGGGENMPEQLCFGGRTGGGGGG